MKNIYFTCLLLAIVSLLVSCKFTDTCPENPNIGNLGSVLNSGGDDYLPIVYEHKIYFTSVRTDKRKRIEEITYVSNIRLDGTFEAAVMDTILPMRGISNSGSPTFYYDTANARTELYFAAIAGEVGKINRDIYVSYNSGAGWTNPKALKFNIATPLYESHPSISPDGKYLIFSTDRPGAMGETDLFVTTRDASGAWTNPVSLGEEINTVDREISPYISSDFSLLFASKGFRKGTGFDIIKAEYFGNGKWGNPKILPYPINSTADDTGPTQFKRKIILSSNRGGGCGGFDIYGFDMCGPAIISGRISGKDETNKLRNTVELYNDESILINSANLLVGDEFFFEVTPNQSYTINYSNNCNEKIVSHHFAVPCSDTSVIKLIADFNANYGSEKYFFERYDIPFFVSGYYQPNTMDNLESLRLKFQYNLFGNSDSTSYIEFPGEEYDSYTEEVELALSGVVDFLKQKLKYLASECANGDENIKIQIRGFADPRPISQKAKFADSPINDQEINFFVNRGEKMDNQLLSKLRAYYTAKLFQRIMEFDETYLDNIDKISWEISGEGEDKSSDTENKEKRRVSINVVLEAGK